MYPILTHVMSQQFKDIPIVTKVVASGSKVAKPQGHTAIKNGMKARRDSVAAPTGRKPDWLRARLPSGPEYARVKKNVREHKLATVCEESMCPNIGECWSHGTATLMLMGASAPAPVNSARWIRAIRAAGWTTTSRSRRQNQSRSWI